MNAYDIIKWNRCNELAEKCSVEMDIDEKFVLYKNLENDERGSILGAFNTVDEVYSFLCGYEHSIRS